MPTKPPSYKIERVTCEIDTCNKKFNVIVSSIDVVVTNDVAVIEFEASIHENTIVTGGIIDNYIIVKCICGHNQRVYLKK